MISTSQNRRLLLFAGMCAFCAMSANLFDLLLGFGDSEVIAYGSRSAREWFDMFRDDPFRSAYVLGMFNIAYMCLMVPVYLGVFLVHRDKHVVLAATSLALGVLALAIYVAGNAALPMWALSGKYAVATNAAQRLELLAAGEAILARGEDFTPGSFPGLFVSGVAAIVAAFVMRRGGVFGKLHAWLGLAGFALLSLFTIVATFVPSWYLYAYYVLGSIGGVLALAWFALTGVHLVRLAEH